MTIHVTSHLLPRANRVTRLLWSVSKAYIAGFELCNAFTELNDPLDQEKRFLEMGRDYYGG